MGTKTREVIRRRFTVHEYHRMGEAGILHEDDRVELVEGEIVEMATIGTRDFSCVNGLDRHSHSQRPKPGKARRAHRAATRPHSAPYA